MKVLIVTSEWPSDEHRNYVPFLDEQVTQLRNAGVEIEVFWFRGRANPLRYASAWWRLRQAHNLSDFDLVHVHFGQSGLVALPCQVPLVVTMHGSDLHGLPRADGRLTPQGRLLRTISRFVARRATRVIVVSAQLLAMLPAGIEAEIIPCGIDLEVFSPKPMAAARADLGLPAGGKLVLFAGDPSNPIKRHSLAVEVTARLDPGLRATLVTLHGRGHSQVPLFMNACDALLVTSFHEGSPMVVKEALACGLPVVSVPVGDVIERTQGIPECRVGRNDDPGELAFVLEEVLRNSSRADKGRASVHDLGHPAVTQLILDVYSQTISTGVRQQE